ncbi:hypothetical protein AB0K09_00385 [Streptomyces sp. NPDC049577]|uniref:hypothetical protein n=1 Tax=Streptomyces sp. NPDC049577 TaxID=3155153 RepID=UPI00342C681B
MSTDVLLTAPVPPTAGLLCTVMAAAWVEETDTTPLGFLLLSHPPARRRNEDPGTIERGMRGLGVALGGLRPTFEKVKHTGNRIALLGSLSTRALLMLDNSPLVYRIPPAPAEWIRHVRAGGPVCIILGLTPVPPLTDHERITRYAGAVVAWDRALVGLSGVTDARAWRRSARQSAAPPCHRADERVDRRKFVTSWAGITDVRQPEAGESR